MATKTQIARAGKAAATAKPGNKPAKTVKQWAEDITSLWRRSIETIIEVSQRLREAKRDLGKDWKKLFDDPSLLPFDEATASKLSAIAQCEGLISRVKLLPASYSTLYELTELTDINLAKAFKKGDIHPNMTRRDALEVVEKYQPKVEEPEPEAEEEDEGEEDNEPAPKSKGGGRPTFSREAEDVHHEPTPKGRAAKPGPTVAPAKGGLAGTLDNLSEAVEGLDYWIEKVEEKLEAEEDGVEVEDDLRERVEQLAERLVELLEKLS
jgi:hypothetical protein